MVAINVQAGVGAHLLDRDPEQARRTLRDIEKVSGEALSDLRSTLGMLREDAAEDDAAPVRPAQGLSELDELGESLRTAGIEVDLDVDPATATLPASVTSTGYRIVQEALTNVVRHAGGSHAQVRVTRGADAVVIEVDDDGGDGRGEASSRRHPGPGRACAGCASARRPRAGRWRPAPWPAAAGGSSRPCRPVCRRGRHDDPGPGGRRPDAGPGRLPGPARLRGRHRGRRRGRRRSGRGRPGRRDPARRRAHGHPDAPARRPGGHRADRGGPDPVRDQGAGAHHLRAGRVRLRRAPGGRVGLPPQGRRTGGAHRRRTPRRRRPGPARAGRDPPADRGLRRGLTRGRAGRVARGARRPTRCPSSPRASARSSPWSAGA